MLLFSKINIKWLQYNTLVVQYNIVIRRKLRAAGVLDTYNNCVYYNILLFIITSAIAIVTSMDNFVFKQATDVETNKLFQASGHKVEYFLCEPGQNQKFENVF